MNCLPQSTANITLEGRDHRVCPLPQYIVLSCALGYLAVAIFLRLPILLKVTLLAIMATVYVLFIELFHLELFLCYDTRVRWVHIRTKLIYIYCCNPMYNLMFKQVNNLDQSTCLWSELVNIFIKRTNFQLKNQIWKLKLLTKSLQTFLSQR